MLDETPFEDPLKVFLLDSLTIYMQVDGRVIKQNQTAVLN
jgi:hypothetical protein